MKIIKPSLFMLFASFVITANAGKIASHNYDRQQSSRRLNWTQTEDELLKDIVATSTRKINWEKITEEFNCKNNNKSRHRTVRSCKERYMNYISSQQDRHFSEEEDEKLISYVNAYGRRWVAISKFFTNKTSTILKNRYNLLCRRKNSNVEHCCNNQQNYDSSPQANSSERDKADFLNFNFHDSNFENDEKHIADSSMPNLFDWLDQQIKSYDDDDPFQQEYEYFNE